MNDSAQAIRMIIGEPFEWCDVPAGEFLYGDDKQTLTLPAFTIARYPITYGQFQPFIDDGGFEDDRWWEGLADRPDDPGEQEWKINDHPRENVSWYDALAFSRWLSWKLGGGFDINEIAQWAVRLPTEFEWEKAARGTDGCEYPWGNRFYKKKCNTQETRIHQTTSVTQYPQGASSYGVFDMAGNVSDWCLTQFEKPQVCASDEQLDSNRPKTIRGGSWIGNYYSARASLRLFNLPAFRRSYWGFRLLRS